MSSAYSEVRINQQEIQRKYDENNFDQKIVWRKIARNDHPAPRQIWCTRSQTIECFDKEWNKIALLHQYKKPDGSIGATGKPDPKRLLIGDTIYYT